MRKYNGVLFDFDLTLADASEPIITCYTETLIKHGYSCPDRKAILRTIGKTIENSLTELSGEIDSEKIQDMKKDYAALSEEIMAPGTKLLPGASEMLRALHTMGYRVGIISTKFRRRIQMTLDTEQLSEYVDLIIGGEDVQAMKPDPEGLLAAVSRFQMNRERVLYVGDHVIDQETAQNAHIDFAGVLTGTTAREEFQTNAVGIYRNLQELKELFSYQAVFSDIDGTILRNDHTPSDRTVRAIQHLVEKKIPFILVSARPPHGIRPISEKLSALNMPVIAYSGGLVLDESGKTLMEVGISASRCEEIVRICREQAPDTSISVYYQSHWMTDITEHPGILVERGVTGLTPEYQNLDDLSSFPLIHKMLCIGPEDSVERLSQFLQSEKDLNVSKSKSTFLEIQPREASKSRALKFYCQKRQIDLQHTIAFGDFYNDIDLLEAAGCGVSMGNAPEDVKIHADFVTDTNEEDGEARILELDWLF